MGDFNIINYKHELKANKYFALQPHLSRAAYSGNFNQSLPPLHANPSKKNKKQVALRLYSITGKSIGHLYEIILLAENENKAKAATKSNCGIDVDSCKEIKGPFLNGHILMMKYVNN